MRPRGFLPLAAMLVAVTLPLAATARAAAPAAPGYHLEAVRGRGTLAALRARMTAEELDQVLRVNRVDAAHVAGLDSLVVPDGVHDFVAPSPFPERLALADSLPRVVIVAVRIQAFAVYDSGRRVFGGPVSTGAATTPTAPGVYGVHWKLPIHRSTVDESWLMRWCVNLDNSVGTALHEYDLPGAPASHCCVRLNAADARRVYDAVTPWELSADGRRVIARGTPVWVVGAYDFDAPPPWRRLPLDAAADRVDAAEIAALLADPDVIP